MATAANTRDIELRISATTSGDEQIKLLAQQLQALAKEGGAAAPAFQQLANEVEKIATQAKAANTFGELQAQVSETGAKAETAAAKVSELGAAFEAQRQKTESFRQSQAEAKAAVDETEKKLREAQGALNLYAAAQDSTSRKTDEAQAKFKELRTAVAELENTLREQKALVAKKSEVNEIEKALKSAAAAYEKAKIESSAFDSELAKQRSGLEAAQKTLEQTGVSASTLAEAQDKVKAAMAATQAEIAKQATAYAQAKAASEQAAAAAKQLAVEKGKVAEAAQKEAAALKSSAEAAAKALDDAFAKTGVRSSQAIKAEIQSIVASLASLKSNAQVSGADFDRAFASAEQRVKRLEAELKGLNTTTSKSTTAASLLVGAFRQFAAVYGAFEAGSQFVTANVQLETLRRSLALVSGSTEEASRQIALLRDTANKAGISVSEISPSFVKFQAALNGASVPLETIESLFKAVVNASGQLGLSSQKTGLILDALGQIANKGTVSMEELRQQLGDSLPGALDISAKGLGITTSELVKLVENGKLLSADYLPALALALTKTFGDGSKEISGFGAEIARLKNAFTQLAQDLGDSGAGKGLILALKGVGVAVGTIGLGLSTAFGSVGVAVEQLVTSIKALINRDLNGLGAKLEEIAKKEFERQTKVAESFKNLISSSDSAEKSVSGVNSAVAQGAKAAETAAGKTDALGTAVKSAGDSANLAGSKWVQLNIQYEKNAELAANQVKVSENLAAAKKIEGEARREIANISENENEKAKAAAETKREEAKALDVVVAAKATELDLIKSQKAQLEALIPVLGDSNGARSKEIEKLSELIGVKESELQKSKDTADNINREAVARETVVKKLKDNSDALYTLQSAYETSKNAVTALQKAFEEGKAPIESVIDAKQRAAVAEALYRDAVTDTIKNLEAKNKVVVATSGLEEAKNSVLRAGIEAEIKHAKAIGDSALELSKTIELKQLDIKLLELKNKALKAEYDATIALIQADKDQLESLGLLTPAKEKEFEARLLNAKAKALEIDKNNIAIKSIQEEIDILNTRGLESKKGSDRFVRDRDAEVDSLDRVRKASEDAAEAERKRLNVDKEGFTLDKSGNRMAISGSTYQSTYNSAKSQGASDQQARAIADRFFPDGKNVSLTAMKESNSRGGFDYGDLSTAILAEITSLTRSGQLGKGSEQKSTPQENSQKYGELRNTLDKVILQVKNEIADATKFGFTNSATNLSGVLSELTSLQTSPIFTPKNFKNITDSELSSFKSVLDNAVLGTKGEINSYKQAKTDSKIEKSASQLAMGNYTVNINMAGKSTPIGVSSAADAQALISMLQQLGYASTRTGP